MIASSEAQNRTVEWYEGEIPAWIDEALPSLYGNLYATLEYIRLLHPDARLCAYVIRDLAEPVQILVYTKDRKRIRVLNSVIRLGEDGIATFARHVFERYDSASIISFSAVEADVVALPFPVQSAVVLEDIVVTLSESVDEYRKRLGRETRRNIKRRMDQLEREYPTFVFESRPGSEVDDGAIRQIIEFHRGRMTGQHKVTGIDRDYEQRILHLARQFGVIGIVKIDGDFAAGAIGYCVGPNFFLHVISHDSQYNRVSVGRMCVYLVICDAIERQAREFHFLWGEGEYKYQFLGVKRELRDLTLYRSRWHQVVNAGTYLANAKRHGVQRVKLWVKEVRRRVRHTPAFRTRRGATVAPPKEPPTRASE